MLGQQEAATRPLVVAAGRPLDIAVDERITIKRVGQTLTGVVVQPVFAYDRIVIPAGTKVTGHIAAIDGPSALTRIRASLSGDLSPARHIVLHWDTLALTPGPIPFESVITAEIPRARRSSAPPSAERDPPSGKVQRAEQEARDRANAAVAEARQRGRDVLAEIKQPGRMARLRDAVVERLPYHPQTISTRTAYHVQLNAPLTFGDATPIEAAPAETDPAPASILNVRLLTPLNSSKTFRGARVQAVVTEPVFSADHQLILAEGTTVDGEVTLARPARRLHRNGQLRFLFESVHRGTADTPLLASVDSIESSEDDQLALDDEGGATVPNSKTRFIAPTLALLALRGTLHQHEHLDPDGDGHVIHSGSPGAASTGGFLGLSVLGIGLSQLSRPAALALSAYGAARTTYSNVLGKGRDVEFPADTVMQLQLAPGPAVR